MEHNNYNFYWVGLIVIEKGEYSEQEVNLIERLANEKKIYPVIIELDGLLQYSHYFETILRPVFHNFKSLYDIHDPSVLMS